MSNKITQTHVVYLVLLTFNPRPPAPKIVSRPPKEWGGYHPPVWISPLGAKSESMWYALIVWPFIYKIRPFWSKSVKKCSRSDVIMTVTPRPTKNIETKRKKTSIFQYFRTKFATCVEIIFNHDMISLHNDMRKNVRKKCAKRSFSSLFQ